MLQLGLSYIKQKVLVFCPADFCLSVFSVSALGSWVCATSMFQRSQQLLHLLPEDEDAGTSGWMSWKPSSNVLSS